MSNNPGHGFKMLTQIVFFKGLYNPPYFFMGLFQSHELGRESGEIFQVGSTLIIMITGLLC
jgi:hypothetical protein